MERHNVGQRLLPADLLALRLLVVLVRWPRFLHETYVPWLHVPLGLLSRFEPRLRCLLHSPTEVLGVRRARPAQVLGPNPILWRRRSPEALLFVQARFHPHWLPKLHTRWLSQDRTRSTGRWMMRQSAGPVH